MRGFPTIVAANKKKERETGMFKTKRTAIALVVLALFVLANVCTAFAAGQILTPGKWAPNTYKSMQKLIDDNGKYAVGYNKNNKPYAMFDWDNTCIMNDTEEALYMYQIENLIFKLTPEEMGELVRKNVPDGPFVKDYNNAAGEPVTIDAVATDIVDSYTFLYDNYVGLKGKMSLAEIKKTDQYLDFRAKMWYVYDAIGETHGTKVSYTWVLFFFKNMTTAEVTALAEKSNDYALGQAIKKDKWVSPASLPGKAGVVGASRTTGLRLTEEIIDLMNTLRANGIDIYVCTASLEDVVAVFATNPKYGYNVARENIIGMRLNKVNDVYQDTYKDRWIQTAEHGKTIAITAVVASKRGFGPILVAGDSSGDYNMMTEFPDVKRVLLVNRLKGGKFGKLCKEAAATIGKPDAKYLLQGRDENTGLWIPTEKMLKLGRTTQALTAN
jgi:phosphoserine phosphatase